VRAGWGLAGVALALVALLAAGTSWFAALGAARKAESQLAVAGQATEEDRLRQQAALDDLKHQTGSQNKELAELAARLAGQSELVGTTAARFGTVAKGSQESVAELQKLLTGIEKHLGSIAAENSALKADLAGTRRELDVLEKKHKDALALMTELEKELAAAKAPPPKVTTVAAAPGQAKSVKERLLGSWKANDSEVTFRPDGYVTSSWNGAGVFVEPDSNGFMGKGYKLKYRVENEGKDSARLTLTVTELHTKRDATAKATVRFTGEDKFEFSYDERPSDLAAVPIAMSMPEKKTLSRTRAGTK
jgi:hypothetical protein